MSDRKKVPKLNGWMAGPPQEHREMDSREEVGGEPCQSLQWLPGVLWSEHLATRADQGLVINYLACLLTERLLGHGVN